MSRTFFAFLSLILLVAGCGQDTDTITTTPPYSEPSILKSTLLRETPDLNSSEAETLRVGESDFAFALYNQIKENNKNLFFSPYSISSAFTMLYAGASGATKSQIGSVFNFLPDDTAHHRAYNALDASVFDGEGNLTSANSIWLQDSLLVYQNFLDTLAIYYGADVKTVDFAANPEAARTAINDWVSDKTYELIPEALDKGSIHTATKFVLVNAIHFMGNWKKTFPDNTTYSWDFYLRDGTTLKVPMMFQSNDFLYYDGSNFSAISLPYDDNDHAMVILLPDTGAFDSVEDDLNRETLTLIVGQMESREIELYLPKFEISTNYLIKEHLISLGMVDAFDPTLADFSGISNTPLAIERVIHKAVIKINEHSTEAAAVTVIDSGPGANDTGNYVGPVSMKINRPFFFFIMNNDNTILFMGKVENPAL